MAFDFNGSGANRLTISPTLWGSNLETDPRPVSFGFRLKREGTGQHWIFENYGGGDPSFAVAVGTGTTTAVLRVYSAASSYTDSATFAVDTTAYHSYMVTWATGGPGAIVFYRDGATLTSTTKSIGTGGSKTDQSVLGALLEPTNPNAGFFIDGPLSEVAVWDRVLTEAEAHAWTNGYSADHFPYQLISHLPMIGKVNQDLRRGDWTEVGTLTKQADHARTIFPQRRLFAMLGVSAPPPRKFILSSPA